MTASPQPRLVSDTGEWTLILERSLSHAPDRVWQALVEPAQLTQWAPFRPDRALSSPGPVQLEMLGVSETSVSEGQVQEVDPPHLLVFTWGNDVLRWELSGQDSTRIVLKHRFTQRKDAPSYAAGWHLCFTALEAVVRGEATPLVVGDAAYSHGWKELYEQYSAQLLPAGTN